MASKGNWTIVFDDKMIIKNHAEGASEGIGYVISDDSFWNQGEFSNLWAIQYGASNTSDEVEYRDSTPHSSYAAANIGDISQFSNRWDVAHLAQLQANWDADVITTYNDDGTVASTESESDQIARKGARPTSYSS
jgi:hypothetical protein|tara:strand:- start:3769 stop:4173 length:405 start_codon:yes stop_codon:yes gene_type:complete